MTIFKDEKIVIIGILLFLVSCSLAWGADIDGGDADFAYNSLDNFRTQVANGINNAMVNNQLVNATNTIFAVFAITLIVFTFFRYTHGTANYDELIGVVILIGFVSLIRGSYDTLTTGIWDWFQGLAQQIQMSFIGSTEPLEISMFIASIVESIVLKDDGSAWYDLTSINLVGVFAMALFGLMSLVVMVMSFFATAWGLWGFMLTKTIGFLLVPFLLFERMAFIFDGWLKMFLGFCFYSLLARINLLLMAMAMKSYFGVIGPISKNTTFEPSAITIDSFADMSGIGSLIFIGLLALVSTGQFATSLAGGAGGFGNALRSLSTANRIMK